MQMTIHFCSFNFGEKMKVKAKRIDEFHAFLDEIHPQADQIGTKTIIEPFNAEEETITLEFTKRKPIQQTNNEKEKKPENDPETTVKRDNSAEEAMDALSQTLLDKLEKIMPLDAKKMTTEVTVKQDLVAFSVMFRKERDKPEEKKRQERTRDENEETQKKKRKISK